MSDDELLKSLDTYACQLREVNAKLIYAAKARIEALRGEVMRLRARDDVWLELDKIKSAERDRLKAESE